jgi:isoquinoline 1-oxidoreductase beta subunit
VAPGIIDAQITGAMVCRVLAAAQGAFTFADQREVEQDFTDYDALRMHMTPDFQVKILQNNGALSHIGGVGEPGTTPAAPALANALKGTSEKPPASGLD